MLSSSSSADIKDVLENLPPVLRDVTMEYARDVIVTDLHRGRPRIRRMTQEELQGLIDPVTLTMNVLGLQALAPLWLSCVRLPSIVTLDGEVVLHGDCSFMFQGNTAFNHPVHTWDTSRVTNMHGMFQGCETFQQPLTTFATHQVTDMGSMFQGASSFDYDLTHFNTKKVTNMSSMFHGAVSFNRGVYFDTEKVTDISSMFRGAHSFDHPIMIDTSRVTRFDHVFAQARVFNNLSVRYWDTRQAVTMHAMFQDAYAFNQSLRRWTTPRLTDTSCMFDGASSFNNTLFADTHRVTTMRAMFQHARSFNFPVGQLDTSNVEDVRNMLTGATSFNHSLRRLDLSKIRHRLTNFIDGATTYHQHFGAEDRPLRMDPMIATTWTMLLT
jgi:surface protein